MLMFLLGTWLGASGGLLLGMYIVWVRMSED